MDQITETLLNLHGPVIYAIVAALVFAEAALFFGFVFPGETAIVVGGVPASQGRAPLPLLIIIVVIAVAALVVWSVRRHRRAAGPEQTATDEPVIVPES